MKNGPSAIDNAYELRNSYLAVDTTENSNF